MRLAVTQPPWGMEEKKEENKRGRTHFLFLFLASLCLDSVRRKYERANGLHAGWSTLSHISSHFSLFPSHSLFWSHYRRSHLSSCSFLTKTSLSYPVLHNEGPLLIWRLWSEKHPLFPPVEGSLQIYKLIWVYEDRVGWGVPFCLPPNIMMRRADWSVKGDINLLSIYWGLNIQLVSYADCIL